MNSAEGKEEPEEEEPDYMSDDFLAKCIPKDVRPSLLLKPGDKRKHELLKKRAEANAANKDRWKPLHEQEKEQREIGLKKVIGEENKGFQLLQKMGYKPGTRIGSASSAASIKGHGLLEPISIEVKGDRQGLGKKTADKQKLAKWLKKREEDLKLADPNEFRMRKQAAVAQREQERDLMNAQSVCQTLDLKENVTIPTEKWYWPKPPKVNKIIEDDKDEGGPPQNKSAKVIQIDDSDSDDDEDVEEDSEDEDGELEPELRLKLASVAEYLRDRYLYCLWCGSSFDSGEDLKSSCPGITKDDH